MNRRSRSGCINCRHAKIKCDEERPFCGTCTRRSKECHGYPAKQPIFQPPLKWTATHNSVEGPPRKKRRAYSSVSFKSVLNEIRSSESDSHTLNGVCVQTRRSVSIPEEEEEKEEETAVSSLSVNGRGRKGQASSGVAVENVNGTMIGQQASPTQNMIHSYSPSLYYDCSISRSLSPFFNSNITPNLAQGISIYFSRHPGELVIGSEPFFVQEMNMHVLGVLQSDVEAVGNCLSAIGQTYLYNQGSQSSLALALSSRQKTLIRIRRGSGLKIEQAVSMILALVSMEVRLILPSFEFF